MVVKNDEVHLVRFLGSGVLDFHFTLAKSGHRGFVPHLKIEPLRTDSMLIPQESVLEEYKL